MRQEPSPLVTAFMARRTEMRRYFAARVGEAEADDLLQEAWLRVDGLAEVEKIRSPGAYLYRLCANIMIDRQRHERNRSARDADWRSVNRTVAATGEEISEAIAPDRQMIARDRLRRVEAAIAELPAKVQQSFRMHKIDGLSHSQVAEELGVSRSLIEKHMMQALRHLVSKVGR